jgi:glutamate:GABA antiporter
VSQVILEEASRERPLPSEGYATKVMPRVLNTFDLTMMFVGIIFVSPLVMSAISAGPATLTYWCFCIVIYLVPACVVTSQLGYLHPNEGALYNWTHKAFGGYWSFFASFCTWIPCMLIMTSSADVTVGYIQEMGGWHLPTWAHGLAMIVVLGLGAAFSVQRFRMVQHFVNLVILLLGLGVLTIGLSGVVWLLNGNPSLTDYSQPSSWLMTFGDANHSGNFPVFAIVIYALLGMEAPLGMGAEIIGLNAGCKKRRSIIVRHLFTGAALLLIGYLIDTFGVLTVQGQKAGGNIFAFVTVANTALGKGWGDLVAIGIIVFFFAQIVIYNYAYARLVFSAGVDQRLPTAVARLNRHRVPANAIFVQTIVTIVFTTVIFMLVPVFMSNVAALTDIVYNVSQGAATILWVASTGILFVDITVLYYRDRQFFLQNLIFPIWFLVLCVILGSLATIATIFDALFFSWVVEIVSNEQWRAIVGSITAICLIIASIGSIFASSQAEWEKLAHIVENDTTLHSEIPCPQTPRQAR